MQNKQKIINHSQLQLNKILIQDQLDFIYQISMCQSRREKYEIKEKKGRNTYIANGLPKTFIILTLKIINIKRKLDSIAARQNSIVSYN